MSHLTPSERRAAAKYFNSTARDERIERDRQIKEAKDYAHKFAKSLMEDIDKNVKDDLKKLGPYFYYSALPLSDAPGVQVNGYVCDSMGTTLTKRSASGKIATAQFTITIKSNEPSILEFQDIVKGEIKEHVVNGKDAALIEEFKHWLALYMAGPPVNDPVNTAEKNKTKSAPAPKLQAAA